MLTIQEAREMEQNHIPKLQRVYQKGKNNPILNLKKSFRQGQKRRQTRKIPKEIKQLRCIK
jgi:hypothetical protein